MTYLFDAMVLQANASPTMVDMKDVMLAADMLRTDGVDQRTIADAYASRGLGAGSKAVDAADTDPVPSFASPTAVRNAQVTVALVDDATGAPVAGSVFVGDFQARVTPVATTLGSENPDPTVALIAGRTTFWCRRRATGCSGLRRPSPPAAHRRRPCGCCPTSRPQ